MSWNLIHSTSLQAQGGVFSPMNCLDIELLAQSKSKLIPEKFCFQDSLTEAYLDSLFGMTLPHSEAITPHVPVTSQGLNHCQTSASSVDSHAKTSAPLEKAQASQVNAVDYGVSSPELLARLCPDTSLWKIPQCSLFADLEQSLETWPRWGSMRNGACYQRQKLAHHIKEKESGLLVETPSGNWPTPTCSDVMTDKLKSTQQKPGSMHSVSLAQAVQMWPTPTVNMVSGGANHNSPQVLAGKHGINLEGAVMRATFPTPTAQDAKNNGAASQMTRNTKPLNAEIGGALNPTWVEWLMGWPLGWTDLKPLVMDKLACVRQPHGDCC